MPKRQDTQSDKESSKAMMLAEYTRSLERVRKELLYVMISIVQLVVVLGIFAGFGVYFISGWQAVSIVALIVLLVLGAIAVIFRIRLNVIAKFGEHKSFKMQVGENTNEEKSSN